MTAAQGVVVEEWFNTIWEVWRELLNPGGAHETEFLVLKWAAIFSVVAVLAVWSARQQKRMQDILDEPESAQEKAARLQIPPGLKQASNSALITGLKEALRSADAYLQSAQHALGTSFQDSALGLLMEKGQGPQEEAQRTAFNELMHADKFLLESRQRLRLLRERRAVELPSTVTGREELTLDWTADLPGADYANYSNITELDAKIRNLRIGIETLSGKLGG